MSADEALRDQVTVVPPNVYEEMTASLEAAAEPNPALAEAAYRMRAIVTRVEKKGRAT